MKILSSRILVAGLFVLGLIATLLMQPAQSFLTAQQSSPQRYLPFQGAWGGTYRFVGGDAQVLMYINATGELFGSLASDDGHSFAQISGQQRNNAFHIIFTAPSGASSPRDVNATAGWENSPDQFSIGGEAVGHPYTYTFTRLEEN